MVKQDCKALGISFDARVDLELMNDIFTRRTKGEKISVKKGLEYNFDNPSTPIEKNIKNQINSYHEQQRTELETELFALKKRLADAERKLKEKPTKTAEKEKAVCERQIERKKTKLENVSRTKLVETDNRIYPFDYAPVVIWKDGERVIVPMRYHLRPPGKPESFDRERPGCYNARRDSLNTFWRPQFGKKHGLMVATSFYENVSKHNYEKRALRPGEKDENIVIQFKPKGINEILIPCIFDHWEEEGKPGFDCFALITDEPPLEVSDAGHDRCPIFIKPENIDAWLNPDGKSKEELFAILDDRIRPFYEHVLAA